MLGALGSADKYSTASVTHTTELRWHCWIQILRSWTPALRSRPQHSHRGQTLKQKNASSVTCTSDEMIPPYDEFGTCIDRF